MELRSLPSFLSAVFVLYWSLPLMAVSHTFIRDMKSRRRDMYMWSNLVRSFFRVRVLKFGTKGLCKDRRPIVYLCNHRSWADFFLDVYTTEGCAALMSRWMVFWAFPVFIASAIALKGILLFKRGTILDKKKFNEWLDRRFAVSPMPGLIVYPEGHRSTKATSLPLKRGMLHYAHSRGMPVQMVISRGKEAVLSEKAMSAAWGTTMVVGFSEVLESKGTEFEAWVRQIQAAWDKLWAEVFAADEKSLSPLIQDPPTFDYTFTMRIQQASAAYVSIPVFWVTMWVSAKVLLAVTAWLGVWGQQALFCGLASWLAYSVMIAQQQ